MFSCIDFSQVGAWEILSDNVVYDKLHNKYLVKNQDTIKVFQF
jgi:hypothetical protein